MRKSMCLAFRNAGGFRIIWESARISRNETASTCSSLKYLRWFRDKNVLIYYCQGEYVIQTCWLVWEFFEQANSGFGGFWMKPAGISIPTTLHLGRAAEGDSSRVTALGNEAQQWEAWAPQWAKPRPSLPQTIPLLARLSSDLVIGHWRKFKVVREYIYENMLPCLKSINKCIDKCWCIKSSNKYSTKGIWIISFE